MQKKKVKRYHLVLPEDIYAEVKKIAEERDTTVVDLFRRFIKLGLLALQVEDDPNASLIIEENGRQRVILLL